MKQKRVIRKKFFLLLIPFVLILIMNELTAFTSDDYMYHFFFVEGLANQSSHELTSILEIVPSMFNHYFFQNGRIVAHTVVQFFAYWDTKVVFNIFNSLAFVGLGILILIFVNYKRIRVMTGIITYFLLWLTLPQFGLTVLWLSGSGNYLWMSILLLLFLLPYRYIRAIQNKKVIFVFPYVIILGFLSGWSNENSGPAALCIAILLTSYSFIKGQKIQVWQLIGMIANIFGFMIMMSSPASLKRGAMSYSFQQLFENFVGIVKMSYMHFYGLIIFILILYALNIFYKYFTEEVFFHTTILFIGAFLGTFSLILSPDYPLRTLFGPTVFVITGIIMIVDQLINLLSKKLKQLFVMLVFFMSLHVSVSYLTALLDIMNTNAEVSTQIQTIHKYRDLKIIEVKKITPSVNTYNAFSESRNLSNDENDWFNQWMAKYYKVNKIRGYD